MLEPSRVPPADKDGLFPLPCPRYGRAQMTVPSADTAMADLLAAWPGARRALFAAFHIGGCQSCAYRDDETLAEVCQRNEIAVDEALRTLTEAQERDAAMLLAPSALAAVEKPLLLDLRTREEFEAVSIPGSQLLTQDLQQEIFAEKPESPIVLIDHQGRDVLDRCAWFHGHGLPQAKGLDGGIDRYAKEVDSSLPRYRLELS